METIKVLLIYIIVIALTLAVTYVTFAIAIPWVLTLSKPWEYILVLLGIVGFMTVAIKWFNG